MTDLSPYCAACPGSGWVNARRLRPCTDCSCTGLGPGVALSLTLPPFPERREGEEAWLAGVVGQLKPFTWPEALRTGQVDMALTVWRPPGTPEVGAARSMGLLEEALVRGGVLASREAVLGWSASCAEDAERPRVEVLLALESAESEAAHGA